MNMYDKVLCRVRRIRLRRGTVSFGAALLQRRRRRIAIMIVILTGEIGAGKTEVCRRLIRDVQEKGMDCRGVITLKSPCGDLVIQDIHSGEARPLAVSKGSPSKSSGSRYCFIRDGFDFANEILSSSDGTDLLVIDEVGRHESEGKGFAAGLSVLTKGVFTHAVIVVQKRSLEWFLASHPLSCEVFEADEENRSSLHRKLISIMEKKSGRSTGKISSPPTRS